MSKAVELISETDQRLRVIAGQFVKSGRVQSVRPLGNGNINGTFLVAVEPVQGSVSGEAARFQERFVLQHINAQVFSQPEQVIQNMVVLSEHVRDHAADLPSHWQTPHILPTQRGHYYWIDAAGNYWRAISFIEDAHVLETVQNEGHAEAIGHGLAMFHRLVSTLPAEQLADTLVGFHITPSYLTQYEQVRCAPAAQSRLKTERSRYCAAFIEQRKAEVGALEQAKAAGHLRMRPIHGDPKVNNIMLDASGQAVGLIDLDTLKPGLVHYDIGDCLRSGCNPLGEETEDWQRVVFDADLARAMLRGYLSLAGDFLSPQDYDYLYDAIRLIAFELGLRFFTDYLAGNVYFKVKHPAHNLTRALVQFKLTESIEQQADTLRSLIQSMR